MSPTPDEGYGDASTEGIERLRRLAHLTSHWSRPANPPSYYWYVTFEQSQELLELVAKCQQAVAFPYYDMISPAGLHLTIDRVGVHGEMSPEQLDAVETAASRTCETVAPFTVTVGRFGGTSAAIGFDVFPDEPVRSLRDTLRRATLEAYPQAMIKSAGFHAHMAIAYCNTDGMPTMQIVAAAEKLRDLPGVEVVVKEAKLVLLERQPRGYTWRAMSRATLGGMAT